MTFSGKSAKKRTQGHHHPLFAAVAISILPSLFQENFMPAYATGSWTSSITG
jgi:hypothetical protein